MRVTVCSEYFHVDAGATGKVLHQLVTGLCRHNPDIDARVITGTRQHRAVTTRAQEADTLPSNVSVHTVRTPPLDRRVPILRLASDVIFSLMTALQLATNPRPDLVVVVTNPFVLPGAAWLYNLLARVPYVYVVHDLYPDIAVSMGVTSERSMTTRILRWLQRTWLGRADSVIALGRCMEERLIRDYGLATARVRVIPNWADLGHDVPEARDHDFRTRHGLPGFLITYSGNFGRFHEFDTILDGAHQLQADAGDVTIAFVGGGAQEEYIRHRVRNEALRNVRIMPYVGRSELASLLRSSDATLLSLIDGAEGLAVPLKLYNLLEAGRPIVAVASPKSEVSLVIAESQCGIQVAPGDVAGFVKSVLELRGNARHARRMGENASRTANHTYRYEAAIRAYHEVFARIASAGTRAE